MRAGAAFLARPRRASAPRKSDSARSTSAWRVSSGVRSRPPPRSSSGRTSWRIQLRRNARSSFDGSPQGVSCRRCIQRTSPAGAPRSGRTTLPAGGMPASPAEPLPADRLSTTVSAWSSAVCATAPPSRVLHAGRLEASYRAARPSLEVGSGRNGHRRARTRLNAAAASATTSACGRCRRSPVDVHCDRREPAVDREGEEHERICAAGASDHDRCSHVGRHLELQRRHPSGPQGVAGGLVGPARASRSTPWRSNARSSLVPLSPSFRPMRRRLAYTLLRLMPSCCATAVTGVRVASASEARCFG